MADDSDFSAPCAEVKNGVRCSRWTTFINGDPTPHEHSFPGESRVMGERMTPADLRLIEELHQAEDAVVRLVAEVRARDTVIEAARELVGDWQANGNSRELGDPTAETWHKCARQLLRALEGATDDMA